MIILFGCGHNPFMCELSKLFLPFFCSIMIDRFDKTGLGAVDSFVFFTTLGINPFRGKYDHTLEL